MRWARWVRRQTGVDMATSHSAVTAFSDAVRRAAAALPNRLVRAAGWESNDAFIVSTENPALPPALRDEEEDRLLVRVDKSTGTVRTGTYVMFLREIASARPHGDCSR